MSKTVRIEYRMTTYATHFVDVPDWFDPQNPAHREALLDNEELSMSDYHDERSQHEAQQIVVVSDAPGSYDFTDLEEPT